MIVASRLCRSKAEYLRLLQESPIDVDRLKRPLHKSALARWKLSEEAASSLGISPEWRDVATARLRLSVGKHVGELPQVFLRTLIHPSFLRKQMRDTHGMPADMLYIGRSLLQLHSQAVSLFPGEEKQLLPPPGKAASMLIQHAGLADCILWRRESFALSGNGDGVPAEVMVAAGTCLVGAVSTIYGPTKANNLLAEMCGISKG